MAALRIAPSPRVRFDTGGTVPTGSTRRYKLVQRRRWRRVPTEMREAIHTNTTRGTPRAFEMVCDSMLMLTLTGRYAVRLTLPPMRRIWPVVTAICAVAGTTALASPPPKHAPKHTGATAHGKPAEVKLKPSTPAEADAPPATASASAPPTRGPTRIDFDDRLIQGQSNKSGAVYLYDRKELKTRSMVKKRESFRDDIVTSVFDT